MKTPVSFLLVASLLFFAGCTTYHITTESLRNQFIGSGQEKKPNLLLPADNINGNSLRRITVLDKHEKEHILNVNFHTGVRIKQKSGKKTTFYFNTLLLTDSSITGSKAHLYNAKIKPILFANVSKIELQK